MFKQNAAYSNVRTDKFLSDTFPIQDSVPWTYFVFLWGSFGSHSERQCIIN
jgi:hypothetical protein